jgi:hypothetical protein
MTANRLSLPMLAFVCLALPAEAADRMRAGQWAGTTTIPGKTFTSSNCITQADADAMNGDIKVDDGQVIYTSKCGGGAANVTTTTYHGDSFVSSDSKGTKSEAKLMGACK